MTEQTERDHVWITDHNGVRVDYSHEQFMAAFRELPLTVRMRAAADVVNDAGVEFHRRPENDTSPWLASAWNLNSFADRWEREDAENARKEQEVEELAQFFHEALTLESDSPTWTWHELREHRDYKRAVARRIIAAGYRKIDQ